CLARQDEEAWRFSGQQRLGCGPGACGALLVDRKQVARAKKENSSRGRVRLERFGERGLDAARAKPGLELILLARALEDERSSEHVARTRPAPGRKDSRDEIFEIRMADERDEPIDRLVDEVETRGSERAGEAADRLELTRRLPRFEIRRGEERDPLPVGARARLEGRQVAEEGRQAWIVRRQVARQNRRDVDVVPEEGSRWVGRLPAHVMMAVERKERSRRLGLKRALVEVDRVVVEAVRALDRLR